MLTKAEEKAIEEAANGKYIKFHTRHHWLLTWLEEQPGKNLADKVWGVIDRAYRADYTQRGREANRRYWQALEEDGLTPQGLSKMISALSEACEYFGRAGLNEDEERAREMLRAVVYQQYKQRSDLAA